MVEQEEPSFEQLLAESERKAPKRVEVGQAYDGTVVLITPESIHIDIGLRSEAILLRKGDVREAALQRYQPIRVHVLRTGSGVEVGLDPLIGHGDQAAVQEAFAKGQPMEGRLISRNKGGFEVNIAGVRAFCPLSQLDAARVEDPDTWLGQTLSFRITECSEDNVVLSRRQLLEEERARRMEEIRATLTEGARVRGKVARLEPFGAFIDLGGGLQGLLHVSECAHTRVNHPRELLQEGEELELQVLGMERDQRGKERISLSRKALLPDPWQSLHLEPGQILEGQVLRKVEFGLFVAIAPAVEGLIPGRYLRKGGERQDDSQWPVGSTLPVEVVEFNVKQKQITLALPGWNEKPVSALKPGEAVQVRVVKILPAGLLVQAVEDPARGLISKHALASSSFKSLEKEYPSGTELRAILESTDEAGRFNFRPLREEDHIESATIDKYMSDQNGMQNNPFAAYFQKK